MVFFFFYITFSTNETSEYYRSATNSAGNCYMLQMFENILSVLLSQKFLYDVQFSYIMVTYGKDQRVVGKLVGWLVGWLVWLVCNSYHLFSFDCSIQHYSFICIIKKVPSVAM